MLSLKTGQPIADVIYTDKKKKPKTLKLSEDITEVPEIIPDHLDELLPKSFYSGLRNVSSTGMILLKKAIKSRSPALLQGSAHLNDIYRAAVVILEDIVKKSFYIAPGEGHLEVLPLQESSRISIMGPSGVGKSTWVGNFLLQYRKKYKKNKIFVFSPILDDDAFNKPTLDVSYVKLDDTLLADPLDISEFENSCLIFDDIESINDKKLQEAVIFFRDVCLETGRHRNITVLCVSHIILNGAQSKKMLNESDEVVVFPRSNFNAIKNLCIRYYGFTKDDVNYLKTIGQQSRWAMVKRSFPTCIVSSNAIRIL